MKYESELIHEILEQRGHEFPDLHYQSECVETWIEEYRGAYPKLCDYESEWLNYIVENPIGEFPYETVTTNSTATVNHVVPFEYKSAILTGQTLVNLFNPNDITTSNTDMYMENGYIILPVKNHRYNHLQIPKEKCQMFEPGEKYTLWVHMLENVTENNDGETQQSSSFFLQTYDYSDSIVKTSNQGAYGCRFDNNEVGTKMCVFEMHDKETMETKSGGLNFDLQCYYAKTGGIQKLAIVILKGDWSNKELPFDKPFYGMQSVKMPVLTTTGKNLLNPKLYPNYADGTCEKHGIVATYNSDGSITFNGTNNGTTPSTFMMDDVKPYLIDGKTYIFNYSVQTTHYDGTKGWSNSITVNKSKQKFIQPYIQFGVGVTVNNVIYYPMLETGTQSTPYEPYKTNILTVNEDVTLRSNGDICDELNMLTGQLTQRIGEDGVVLSQEVVKTVELNIVNQDGETLSKIKPIEGTMHINVSGPTIAPTAVLEVPVEAITQNLASFIEMEE